MQRVQPVVLAPGQQPGGVLEAALPAAQLAQAHRAVDHLPGAELAEQRAGGRQLRVGGRPRALPQQHVGVMDAAHGEHEAVVEAPRDLADALAPLGGALEVAHALAGVDQVAADRLGEIDVGDLAGDGRGRGGVEPAHAVLDRAEADEREPLEPEREDLDVGRGGRARDGARLGGERARGHRVVAGHDRVMAAQGEREGPALARRAGLGQHQRPLDPTVGLGAAAERVGVDAELDRDPRRCLRVVPGAGQAVAALVRGDGRLAVAGVARRDPEALMGGRRLLDRQRRREAPASLLPRAAQQRGAPLLESAGRGRLRHHGPTIRPGPAPLNPPPAGRSSA